MGLKDFLKGMETGRVLFKSMVVGVAAFNSKTTLCNTQYNTDT